MLCGRRLPLRALRRALWQAGAPEHSVPRRAAAFSSLPQGGGGAGEEPPPSATSLPSPLQAPRRRRRALSPLDRLSQLIPAELLSEEVTELRGTGAEHHTSTPQHPVTTPQHPSATEQHPISHHLPATEQHPISQHPPATDQTLHPVTTDQHPISQHPSATEQHPISQHPPATEQHPPATEQHPISHHPPATDQPLHPVITSQHTSATDQHPISQHPPATDHPLHPVITSQHAPATDQHIISQHPTDTGQPPMEEPSLTSSSIPQPLPARTQPPMEEGHLDSNSQSLADTPPPCMDEGHLGHAFSQPLSASTHPSVDHLSPNSSSGPLAGGWDPCSEPPRDVGQPDCHPLVGKGSAFKVGDLCLAEFRKKYFLEFKKMFTLTETSALFSNWGAVSHGEITGKLPGQMLKTSIGFQLLFRRPSLEDFVMLMKRGPAISYPKDSHAMLSMMDVHPGDTLLEAGSGSGGMSLYLSRAAGSEGRVFSFDVRSDHHRIAKKNYQRWRNAWEIGHGEKWPDNVHFINKDLSTANEDIKSITFDAVALDMIHPQVALPVVFPKLKSGGVCAVYIANITQVIDLLEGIRACKFSLLCENITEVIHKDWLVVPSRQKDGSISQRVAPKQFAEAEFQEQEPSEAKGCETEKLPSDEVTPFGSVPYIARPFPWQTGHTAFLVKLRKFTPASTNLVPHDNKQLKEN